MTEDGDLYQYILPSKNKTLLAGDSIYAKSSKSDRSYQGQIKSIDGNTVYLAFNQSICPDIDGRFKIYADFMRTPFRTTLRSIDIIQQCLTSMATPYRCLFPENKEEVFAREKQSPKVEEIKLNKAQKTALQNITKMSSASAYIIYGSCGFVVFDEIA